MQPPADPSDAHSWLPRLYDCVRQLAARELQHESKAASLQPTALVHEAYLRLVDAPLPVRDETHFMAMAARVVRQVLVDHARRREAQKRGGGWARVTLHPVDASARPFGNEAIDVLILDEALRSLEASNERAARVVELRFFSGLSIDETARALGISASTVDIDWRFARAWLSRMLEGEG